MEMMAWEGAGTGSRMMQVCIDLPALPRCAVILTLTSVRLLRCGRSLPICHVEFTSLLTLGPLSDLGFLLTLILCSLAASVHDHLKEKADRRLRSRFREMLE